MFLTSPLHQVMHRGQRANEPWIHFSKRSRGEWPSSHCHVCYLSSLQGTGHARGQVFPFFPWAVSDCISRQVFICSYRHQAQLCCISAYEGQSGSKDRGDPEVRVNTFAFLRFRMVSFADFQPFCGQFTLQCHRAISWDLFCPSWSCRLCKNHVATRRCCCWSGW